MLNFTFIIGSNYWYKNWKIVSFLIAILQDFARVRRAEVEERLAREETAAPPGGSGEKHTVQFNMATIAPYDEAAGRQAKPGKEYML